jgi:REP element-mobilizing transposase RayT
MARAVSYHTRTSLLFHCVFSTKNRVPLIPAVIQPRLWAYIGGIARANRMKALAVGGMPDHLYLLLSLLPKCARLHGCSIGQGGFFQMDA